MNNILQFDLYIFDLDGVIINSEYKHFIAYKNALEQLNYQIDFDTNIYNEKQHINNNLVEYFNNLSYEKIYNLKKQYLINNIDNIELIPGFNIYSVSYMLSFKVYIFPFLVIGAVDGLILPSGII